MNSISIDFEDAEALANLVEQSLEYEFETDRSLWVPLLKRLNKALEDELNRV